MKKIAIILAMFLAGCATQGSKDSLASSKTATAEAYIDKGYTHLSNRETQQALEYFDKAIYECEGQYSNDKETVYASRGPSETLYYLTLATTEKKNAIAVAPTCAYALYLKGFAILDLGKIDEAETYLKRAVDMAPMNSMFLSELGNIYHAKKDWNTALGIFILSEEAANLFSPDLMKERELTRAMRGTGYSLIELGRLDEAEEKFKECLKINSDDEAAKQELHYIEQSRTDR